MSVSIIIPVYNALAFAQACIESIYRVRTSVPFEVIVVNNGSAPEVRAWLSREEERRPNLRALHFDEPLGFARANNVGARQGRYDFLVLLNSDTVVTDGWLEGLRDAMVADPGLGVISPVSNSVGSETQMDPDAEALYSHQARGYAKRIRSRREVVFDPQRLVFFCVMIRRTLWERLAGLEEVYGIGNFEDDDFCLRARLAGYRLGVARNVFVFHHEQATFRANNLDHALLMERNQLLFCDRASRWARSREPFVNRNSQTWATVSVIVPVTPEGGSLLRDSLASLANQTSAGFETIVVSSPNQDVANAIAEFSSRLRITKVEIPADRCDQPAALLNAGLAAAGGEQIAYLPAGDIYYPYHLELLASVLSNSGMHAAYTSWTLVESDGDRESRGVMELFQLAPDRLVLGDRAPLPCWMHSRSCTLGALFDESFRTFTGWQFLLHLSQHARVQYIPRLTWEHRLDRRRRQLHSQRVEEARRVMEAFPVTETLQHEERVRFLDAVENGNWEKSALVLPLSHARLTEAKPARKSVMSSWLRGATAPSGLGHRILRGIYRAVVPLHIRHQMDRKVRELLGFPPIFHADFRKLQETREGLAKAILGTPRLADRTGPPDIILFNIIAWDHLAQRPHHFARELASHGHRVFWVDVRLKPVNQIDRPLPPHEFEPGIFNVELPAVKGEIYGLVWEKPILDTMEIAMCHIRAVCGIRHAIQLVNYPKWTPLVLLLRDRFGWPIVYDCLDDQKGFAELYRLDAGRFEDELAKNCELLVASSIALYEEKRRLKPNTILINNACDYDLFGSAGPSGLLGHLPHPIVGFFGAFGDWLDFEWIEETARRFPSWSFVYIGRQVFARPAAQKRWKEVTTAANIHVFPQADPRTLASYLTEFDVCTMPFQNIPITQAMNPVKVYEYLAAGKVVVAPDLPEMRPFAERGLVSAYRNKDESFRLLEQAIATPPTANEIAARRSFAAQNTWTKRVEKLISKLPVVARQSHDAVAVAEV